MSSLMPTPFTSKGVGSAIPASKLGGVATWTIAVPGTTVADTIISGTTVPGTTVEHMTKAITGFLAPSSSSGSTVSTSSKGAAVGSGGDARRGIHGPVTGLIVASTGFVCGFLGL
jgi:hypothetical protein